MRNRWKHWRKRPWCQSDAVHGEWIADALETERNEALDLLEEFVKDTASKAWQDGVHLRTDARNLLDRLREKPDVGFTTGHTEVARVNADDSRGFYTDDKNEWTIYTQNGRVIARGEGDKVLQIGDDPKKQTVREKVERAYPDPGLGASPVKDSILILADAIDRLEAER